MPLDDTQQLFDDLRRSGEAMGRIAEDESVFRAALDAFRAEDGESFQRLLGQLGLAPDCERICRWFCAKDCVLLCLELAGPWPEKQVTVDELPRFAEILVKITEDEELVERLADAIQDRDKRAFGELLKQVGGERFAHLICHWACQVRCRVRCRIVCSPRPIEPRNFVGELGIAGSAVRRLLENRDSLAELIKGALELDCERVASLVGNRGDCEYICLWLCSWRCVLVCRRLCGELPRAIESPIEEMRAFAQAVAGIARMEGGFTRLTEAVLAQDEAAFSALVKELKLTRFCHQLCHWICYESCERFCFCICRPPATIPLFTHVGSYRVDPIWNDFTADGTTTAGGLAFTGTIPLIGILPDGTAPVAEEYRFRTEKYPLGGGPQDVIATMISPTVIGQLEYWDWNGHQLHAPLGQLLRQQPGRHGHGQHRARRVHERPGQQGRQAGWLDRGPARQRPDPWRARAVHPDRRPGNLDTTKLTNEIFDLSVVAPPLPVKAGDGVPAGPTGQRSEKPHFKIYFDARKLVGGAPVSSNERDKIALSNTLLARATGTLIWAGGAARSVTIPVAPVDIVEEASGGGCVPLSKHVHVVFTAYHPYLGSLDVRLEGPGIPPPAQVNPAISADGQAVSPAGGHDFNIAALTPCAYIVWLEGTLNLTSGYGGVFGTFSDHMAFCTK